MKTLIYSALFLLAGALVLPIPAAAQFSYDITNPVSILTNADVNGCTPQNGDLGTSYYAGCCGSPGRRGCATGIVTLGAAPVCLKVSAVLRSDPYGAQPNCSLALPAFDPALSGLGLNGADATFYVTSDIHFFRSTFNLSDQLTHVGVINNFFSTHPIWPTGTGIPPATPVAPPLAVIVDGDLTTHGEPQDLGAFRLNWERGTIPDSISYPVLFGLGNHDIKTDNTAENAHRMFDYLQARMANTHMDPASGNYSWDWNGVHMIQLNTWAGDQTSMYSHFADGLGWLASDLQKYVGNSTKPVLLFQHYRLADVDLPSGTGLPPWWPRDGNATDLGGNLTGQGYETFFNLVRNYNVIGMFSGHDHCLGVSNTLLASLPITGRTFPGVPGYGLPIDDFDDGSGGDTGDGGNSAGVGNPCGQDFTGSFLAAHVNQNYLDVAAVSWNPTGSAPTIFFDPSINMPGSSAVCRKRINSQFIPVPAANISIVATGGGYVVTSTTGTPLNVPVALEFLGNQTLSNFDFVDSCADPNNTVANNLFMLVNGENNLVANTPYPVNRPGLNPASLSTPVAVFMTPLSGASTSSFLHITAFATATNTTAIAPPDDTFTVYGPPGKPFTTSINYFTSLQSWVTLTPAPANSSGNFDSFGTATFTIHYVQTSLQATQEANATAQIVITTPSTRVAQNVTTEIDFKAPVTLTLTANPAAGAPQGSEPEFTANLNYNPIQDPVNGGSIRISGVVNLMDQIIDPVSGAVTSTTSLSTALVNTATDNCNSPANDTVVFGGPLQGDGLCPSFSGSNIPGQLGTSTFYSSQLPAGLHHLVASYQGSGGSGGSLGDSFYAPASSPTLVYRIGDPLSAIAKLSGDNQTTVPGGYFAVPLEVQVSTSTNISGGPANALVTFTVVSDPNGPSATFVGGLKTLTIVTNSSGIAAMPALIANSIVGTWHVHATVPGLNTSLSFTLTNAGKTTPPTIQVSIVGKSGPLSQRQWLIRLTNTGGVTAGQVSFNSLSLVQQTGTPCSTAILSGVPMAIPVLPATGNNIFTLPVNINFGSCSATSRFTVNASFTTSAGQNQSQVVIANQFP